MVYKTRNTRIAPKSISSLAVGLLLLLTVFTSTRLAAPAHANDPVFYVAPSPPGTGTSGGSCNAPGFNTIQSAVSSPSVPPGSLIIVCPGTYVEQVNIGKSLSLLGSGPSSTTVKAPPLLVPDTAGQFSIVTISGAITVSISGFTISGPGPGGCGSIHYGILVKGGATASIFGNSIVHIRDVEGGTISGCQNGAGIRVGRAFTLDTGTASIKGNSISDYQKGGIVVDGTGTKATVLKNTVIGVGPTSKIAQNGIQVGRGAAATIEQNTVSGNECNHIDIVISNTCGPDLDNEIQDGGILLFNDSPAPLSVTVTNNNVFGNDAGILPFFVTDGISISCNNIRDNRFGNLVIYSSNKI